MQRRQFLAAAAASALAMATSEQNRAAETKSARQWFDLRIYHFSRPASQQAYSQFLQQAAVPALNRASIGTVGVFQLNIQDNPDLKRTDPDTDLYLLLPHDSAESLATLEDRLAADADYQKAGSEILTAIKPPAYTRYDSTILLAMESVPRLQPATHSPTRIFQMRTYESPNNERARSKLDMFNSGEIPLFARSGMPGVFFGSAIAGSNLPHLTYMLAHENISDVPKAWKRFGKDPDWKRISSEPKYKDNVSKIANLLLRPAAGSQI